MELKTDNRLKYFSISFIIIFLVVLFNINIYSRDIVFAESENETLTGGAVEVDVEPTLSDIQTQSLTVTGAVISVSCDKSATIHYIVAEDGYYDITKDKIKNADDAYGIDIVASGSFSSNGKYASLLFLRSLESETSYIIYLYAEDQKSLSSSILSYSFTTNSPYKSVTYDPNGASSGNIPIDSGHYNTGDKVKVMENTGELYKTGYNFAGWNTKSSGIGLNRTPSSTFYIGSENVILYAKWTAEKYYVRYNGNGYNKGLAPSSSIYRKYNDTVTISYPGSMGKSGYTFSSWNTKADGSGKSYAPGDKIKMPASDVKLYAIWNETMLTVKFETNGGSKVQNQNVVYAGFAKQPTNVTMSGFRLVGWYSNSGLTVPYDFKKKPVTNNVTLYAKWEKVISNSEVLPIPIDSGANSQSPIYTSKNSQIKKIDVLLNGKVLNAGSIILSTINNRNTASIVFDNINLQSMSEKIQENAVVTVPVRSSSDVIVGQLNAETMKVLYDKDVVIDLQSETASFKLPARELNVESILNEDIGSYDLKNVNIQIEISKAREDKIKNIERLADDLSMEILMDPVEFNVRYLIKGNTYEKTNYKSYVERSMLVPDDIDASRISTGVVIDKNGEFRHIPTKIDSVYGKYYAVLRSLTNSTYSLIWNPVSFNDIDNHWAKDSIEELGSKLIVTGDENGSFLPDDNITRAELTIILAKALGFPKSDNNGYFSDINESDWFAAYVNSAYELNLVEDTSDGNFNPNEYLKRQEAISMIGKSLRFIGIDKEISERESLGILENFADYDDIARSNLQDVALCVKKSIVKGKEDNTIAPNDMLTRAEVATMISELLKKFDQQ